MYQVARILTAAAAGIAILMFFAPPSAQAGPEAGELMFGRILYWALVIFLSLASTSRGKRTQGAETESAKMQPTWRGSVAMLGGSAILWDVLSVSLLNLGLVRAPTSILFVFFAAGCALVILATEDAKPSL